MLPRWMVIVAFAVVACGGKSSSSTKDNAMRTYKLVPANNASSAPITVTIALPGDWKENTSDSSTKFDLPGLDSGSMVSLTAIELTGAPADQMSKAIDMQDLTDGQRSDLSGGRVWVQKTEGSRVHGRLFLPYAGGVVMGVAMLKGADQLPAIRKVFESMTVGGH